MAHKPVRMDADIARVRMVLEIRRSGAASPDRNRRKYRRADAKREAARSGA